MGDRGAEEKTARAGVSEELKAGVREGVRVKVQV